MALTLRLKWQNGAKDNQKHYIESSLHILRFALKYAMNFCFVKSSSLITLNGLSMKTKRIAEIGEVHWHDNQPYFLFGNTDNGFIFKDYEAYKNDWNAPCYVPEFAAEDHAVTIDGIEYECGGHKDVCDWFSHNDLLRICDYNHKICDCMFDTIDWCYPETWAEDYINHGTIDFNDAYDLVKLGAKVYWKDPDNDISSGYYEVVSIKDGNHRWFADTIVVISNGSSEAEVYLNELISERPY